MPKQTFYNLPEAKQQMILDIAMEEFSTKTYDKASLSKVVAEAGIAKGSMYQYFEDKRDLFTYLVEIAAQKKIAYIQKERLSGDEDFFTMFEKMSLAGAMFNLQNPKLGQLMASIFDPTAEPFFRDLYSHLKKMSLDYMINLISENQKLNKLRGDIDPHLAAHTINGFFSNGLVEYFLQDLDISYHEFLTDPDKTKELTEERIKMVISQITKIIRNGLEGDSK